MPVTVRGGDILFNDGTTQATAAGALNTTAVLNATAGATAGAVGTYAFLNRPSVNGNPGGVTIGGTIAGSTMRYASAGGATSGTPSGTWRCMGFMSASYDGYQNLSSFGPTLWLRIS
jgi:hypothetical protein